MVSIAATATGAPGGNGSGEPAFRHLSAAQQQRFLSRVERAPDELRALIERAYPGLAVRASGSDLGGGDYTRTVIDSEGMRFVVALSRRSLAAGTHGDHMTMHELGHVVVNAFFSRRDYQLAFAQFRASPAWRDCFPAPPGSFDPCVAADEILAEQIAFMASSRSFRSDYEIPPLLERPEMARRLRLLPRR